MLKFILSVQAMFNGGSGNFAPGGYYIAAPYPGPSSSAPSNPAYLGPRNTAPPTSSQQTQGFIYGPYSYPYSGQQQGRVMGPVIALGMFICSSLKLITPNY